MRTTPSVLTFLAAAALAGCAGDDDGGSGTEPLLPVADVDAPCSELDSLSDGTIDVVYRYTYDAAGFVSHYTGEPTGIVADLTYDANHFLLHFAFNSDADAALEFEDIYTRDSAGRVLTYEQRDETGVVETSSYTRDARGRITRSVIGRQGSAGLVTSTTDYVYTGDQLNPTSARLTYPDGATSIVYTSSADQSMVHLDLDDGEDGTVDRTSDLIYDGRRRVVSSISRSMGTVTSRQEVSYNARGSLVGEVFANNDVNEPDDYVSTYQYSSAGMLTQTLVTSPSGEYASSIYSDTYKSTCTSPTVAAHLVRGVVQPHLRPSRYERPLTPTAP